MSLIEQFIKDYLTYSLAELNYRWSDRYDQVPSVADVILHLRETNNLKCMIDGAVDPERGSFLMRDEGGYVVFNLLRGMRVSEAYFKELETAVTEKLSRTIVGLGGRMRGC